MKLSLLLLTCLLLFFSCFKSDSGTGPISAYVTGSEYFNGGTLAATYWTNGKRSSFVDTGSFATCIAVASGHVYVTGYDVRAHKDKFWKNGIPAEFWNGSDTGYLSHPNGYFPNSIAVSGADVYIAGYIIKGGNYYAAYWKNASLKIVGDSGSIGESIAVSGNNIFLLGQIAGNGAYWSNGKPTMLLNNGGYSIGTCIAISGQDVYVAGGSPGPMYWKNGSAVNLPNPTGAAFATAIAVSGNDVYLAGSSFNSGIAYALYWKNGEPHILGEKAQAFSIAVSGSDVYVTGYSGQQAVYWKNDNMIKLAEVGQAYGIFIAKAF